MSRHRIVRSMDYNDEYDGYDDVYGHSVDDDSCISPSDAQQWLYDRARGQQSMSSFIATHRNIQEEDEDTEEHHGTRRRHSSEDFQMPTLNDEDQGRLLSCMEEIRNVVGEMASEKQLVETILKNEFDCAKSLDEVLQNASSIATPKPPPPKAEIEKDLNPVSLTELIKRRSLNGLQCDANKMGLGKILFVTKEIDAPKDIDKDKSTFNSLSDLANFRLQKANSSNVSSSPTTSTNLFGKSISIPRLNAGLSNNPKFIIPKLNNAPNLISSQNASTNTACKTELTPHELSMKKIMDFRKIQISEHLVDNTSPEKVIIDLSTALHTIESAVPIILQKIRDPKIDQPFVPIYIDCDQPLLLPIITQDCEIDISSLCNAKLSHPKFVSKFGKILCSKYRCKSLPYVKHEFHPQNNIPRYVFGHPSPDDIVLRQLEKFKR